ncbi:daunorubicin resistance protein DrrA family ABC transporter ATP-binding protein [Catenulispora yoronensis]|uniref:Daunorubicin resistance protein DrrA family ABC transporter ATP-binding protein n=1 Tax=Catenulispora yoronensis TaxID=450799 RepID=A0ABN2VM61_9ACTN
MDSSAIAVTGLRKNYGDKPVLAGIDFEVAAGTVFSMLGPNGAGKTTTVNVLTTLLAADAGTVRVAGYDVATQTKQVRAAIGVTGQFAAVDDLLTGRENLRLMADLRRIKDADQVVARLLEQFELTEAAGKPTSTYSGGMRRKLDLAMTLVGRPRIIFLDEPTTGLDPRSRRTMWQIVRELVAGGTTIFLTTQYLDEADQLADQLVVLDQGRLVAQGTPAELKRRIPGTHVRLRFADQRQLEEAARILPGAQPGAGHGAQPGTQPGAGHDDQDLTLRVPSDGGSRSLRDLLDRLAEHSLDAEEFSVHTPDLDDVFLALTGHATTEANAE